MVCTRRPVGLGVPLHVTAGDTGVCVCVGSTDLVLWCHCLGPGCCRPVRERAPVCLCVTSPPRHDPRAGHIPVCEAGCSMNSCAGAMGGGTETAVWVVTERVWVTSSVAVPGRAWAPCGTPIRVTMWKILEKVLRLEEGMTWLKWYILSVFTKI